MPRFVSLLSAIFSVFLCAAAPGVPDLAPVHPSALTTTNTPVQAPAAQAPATATATHDITVGVHKAHYLQPPGFLEIQRNLGIPVRCVAFVDQSIELSDTATVIWTNSRWGRVVAQYAAQGATEYYFAAAYRDEPALFAAAGLSQDACAVLGSRLLQLNPPAPTDPVPAPLPAPEPPKRKKVGQVTQPAPAPVPTHTAAPAPGPTPIPTPIPSPKP